MKPALDTARLLAPLVIGVTGHRDLRAEDLDHLERRVKDIFSELRAQYAATPFVVLSPLAEGADRLVARIALMPEFGARLVAPLPMPRRMYEQDFQEPRSLENFRELLEQAGAWFELPLLASEEAVTHPGEARNLQYEAAGKYIVRQSQILIALWDGMPSEKVGGTAAVVKFQVDGLPERQESDLQAPELFPVYQVVTPRQSNPFPAGDAFTRREIYPRQFRDEAEARQYYARIFQNLDNFNAHAQKGGEWLASEVAMRKQALIGTFDEADLPSGAALTLNRYAVADALASRFRRDAVNMDTALHWNVFAWFLFLVSFAHLPGHPPVALAISLALVLYGLFYFRRAYRKALDNKSQDYRAAAEGCRVRFFWQLAGISESVPDNYLGKQRTELDWIRSGLRGWEIGPHDSADAAEAGGAGLEFVRSRWVEGQRDYFDKAAEENIEHSETIESRVRWCLTLAFVLMGLVLAAALVHYAMEETEWYEKWLDYAIIAIDGLLAAGALFHHFGQRMAYSEHSKQYKRMKSVFENASELVLEKLRGNDLDAARALLRKLGQEALAENGDWVLLHRERPLELPHP